MKDIGWIPAGELNVGDLVKLQSGEFVPVEDYEVVQLDEPIKVYNFVVAFFSNFRRKFNRKRTAKQMKSAEECTKYTLRISIRIMCLGRRCWY